MGVPSWLLGAFQSRCAGWARHHCPIHPAISSEHWRKSALSLLPALPRLLLSAAALLSALAWLLAWLLTRLLLAAAALLSAAALAPLVALILLTWLWFVGVHNCSLVSSLATTKPRPLSFLRRLVRNRTIRPLGVLATR